MDFLNELNEAQREAVLSVNGPNMIIAGAGSGKTRVITYRLAFIIQQGLADPFELLALTFTNKAAREMRERISKIAGLEAKNIWMGTFHSVFSRILRQEAEKLGYTREFTIYDTDDALSSIKEILRGQNIDDKSFKPKNILNLISNAKNYLIDAEEFESKYVVDTKTEIAARVYKIYTEKCFKANAMDFDDLLIKPIELFTQYPDILHKYQHRFKYIMVDEYQDTNYAQYLITRKLAAVHENICVVGDDAQSIYSFRGATIQNILNFKSDYPDVKVHKLEQNYRSTSNIVHAANSVIAHNEHQLEKRVFTDNETGDKIQLIITENENEEARKVVDSIREQKQVHSFLNRDFAILYRTNMQSRTFEDQLRKAGIAYRIYGGLSFYRRKEIKDMLAYMRLAINPKDDEALKRVINYPVRGIGNTTVNHMIAKAGDLKISFWEVLEQFQKMGFSTQAQKAIAGFVDAIKAFGTEAIREDAHDAASFIAKNSGMLKELHSDESAEGVSRWQNVQELLNALREFTENPENKEPYLHSFMSEIALFTDQDDTDKADSDVVSMMTLHSAKGLEYNSVYIVGVEEGLFPGAMSMNTREDMEEERRLFYVGITRAMKQLTLSYARTRNKFGQFSVNEPSRFIREIKAEFISSPHTNAEGSLLREIQKMNMPMRRPGTRDATPAQTEAFIGDDLSNLATGNRVEHGKFGLGKVLMLEGEGDERKATIAFDAKGEKLLVLKYAKLKIME